MKRAVIFSLGITFLFGCSFKQEELNAKAASECIAPSNPYNDGGGHDAGFKWAEENGGDCNGNSDAFNEGCQEYHRQLEEYNQCLAKAKK